MGQELKDASTTSSLVPWGPGQGRQEWRRNPRDRQDSQHLVCEKARGSGGRGAGGRDGGGGGAGSPVKQWPAVRGLLHCSLTALLFLFWRLMVPSPPGPPIISLFCHLSHPHKSLGAKPGKSLCSAHFRSLGGAKVYFKFLIDFILFFLEQFSFYRKTEKGAQKVSIYFPLHFLTSMVCLLQLTSQPWYIFVVFLSSCLHAHSATPKSGYLFLQIW